MTDSFEVSTRQDLILVRSGSRKCTTLGSARRILRHQCIKLALLPPVSKIVRKGDKLKKNWIQMSSVGTSETKQHHCLAIRSPRWNLAERLLQRYRPDLILLETQTRYFLRSQLQATLTHPWMLHSCVQYSAVKLPPLKQWRHHWGNDVYWR